MSSKAVTTARSAITVSRVAGRWLSGGELNGERRTDATLLRKGSKVVHSSGRAATWHYQSRWQRAKWRTIGTVALGYLLWGYVTGDPQAMAVLWSLLSFTTLVVLRELWRLWTEGRERAVEERVAKAMATRFGSAPGGMAHDWVRYVPARRGKPTTVTVTLSRDYGHSLKQAEKDAELVARKSGFPLDAYDHTLMEDVEPPRLVVQQVKVPPSEVLFEAAEQYMAQAGNGYYFIGLGIDEKPVWGDLNGDGPHWVWSCGTGAGKTSAVRNVAAQVRREGGRVLIFDCIKRDHADWIHDEYGDLLPGIEHFRTIEEVFWGLQAVAAERERRTTLAEEAKRYGRPAPTFPRMLVVLEEQNATYDELTAFWKANRKAMGHTASDPNPAMTAIRAIVYAGRSAFMHAFVACQRFDANIIGGGAVRGNFMVRMLARFDIQTIRMLIPDIKPVPISSNHLGRAIVCMEGEATPVQGTFLTPAQTREWAMGSPDEDGRTFETLDLSAVSQVSQVSEVTARPTADQAEQADSTYDGQGLGHRHLTLVPEPPVDTLTLSEAVEQGVVTGTKGAIQRASSRPGFPTPRVKGAPGTPHRYAKADLMLWDADRRSAPVDADGGDAS